MIFLNGLNGLDISKRPIHCSDLKRETIYIKDKDIWEKENDERNKLKLAIKTITSKNIKQIPKWQKENRNTQTQSQYISHKLSIFGFFGTRRVRLKFCGRCWRIFTAYPSSYNSNAS
jgi:hypothetical protein